MATQSVTQLGAATQVEPFFQRVLGWTTTNRQATNWVYAILIVEAVLVV